MVSYETSGHISVVTLDNPPTNALSAEILDELADCLARSSADRNVRVTVLRSQGKVFCSGADLIGADPARLLGSYDSSPFYRSVPSLFQCEKPIVAAVQGAAVGAGLGVALIADFRLGVSRTYFAANFVQFGLHPGFSITYTLEQVIGLQRSKMMLLSGHKVGSAQALEWGLLDIVSEDEGLMADTLMLAERIAACGPLAVAETKKTLTAGYREAAASRLIHEHSIQTRLMQTNDFAEGIAAVRERRMPRFQAK